MENLNENQEQYFPQNPQVQEPIPQKVQEPLQQEPIPRQTQEPIRQQVQEPAANWQQPTGYYAQNSYTGGPRFDPQVRYQPVYQNIYPQNNVEQTSNPPKAKKAHSGNAWKVILSVLLVAVLALGCSSMGAYVGIRYVQRQNAKKTEQEYNQVGGIANVQVGDRQNVDIQVNKIDTSKVMTPAEIYALNVNSTVGITTSISTNYWGYTTTSAATGSGFVYSKEGYIITNFHVIEDSDSISVSLYDGTSLDAKLVGYDESNDVAVLKVEHDNLTPVVLGDSDNMHVGDTVLAIGNPLGELTFSLTSGTVSALNREVTFSGGMTMNLIQTDCAINSGNSGGALFNLYGEVVGITNAKYSGNSASGASIDNIGFAIPMNDVRSIVDSIIQVGYVVKPYIGVEILDVSQEAQEYGLPKGVSIRNMVTDSPAAKAGLKKNDIVTAINGEAVETAAELKRIVSASKPGDVLQCTVWRRNAEVTVNITVGEQNSNGANQQQQQQQPIIQIPGYDWGF